MTLTTVQNLLLRALPAAELQRLAPRLERVELARGAMLYEAGATIGHVHFPETAIVSLTTTLQDGASVEVAVVGQEGIVGVCAYMGGGRSLSSAVVQTAGQALRMTAASIRDASRESAPLMQELLRYTQVLFTHMAQTSACSRHHALDQQLCRWLLLHLDRLSGNELLVTQERIGHMLGVRRESVTAGALELQRAGLIEYGRGRICILDRSGLEARSCECYAVVRGAYDRLQAGNASAAAHLGAHWPSPRPHLPARQLETA
ncbi:Crp/Fnr family transcriptional regulator [Ideonella sp. A 288]|uniref:Crp/Fnr family transcriptional regulator n=1 Tax=Ideonella sp. A 288 TaxID=1962181 RepID=UPI0018FE7844|nr:Crp/Fnr family transcriptional regulator [Ideonella sp. A 288]